MNKLFFVFLISSLFEVNSCNRCCSPPASEIDYIFIHYNNANGENLLNPSVKNYLELTDFKFKTSGDTQFKSSIGCLSLNGASNELKYISFCNTYRDTTFIKIKDGVIDTLVYKQGSSSDMLPNFYYNRTYFKPVSNYVDITVLK